MEYLKNLQTFEQFVNEAKNTTVEAPDTLYHATPSDNKKDIKKEGLIAAEKSPLVFLADSEKEARQEIKDVDGVTDAIIFKVDAGKMQEDGIEFAAGKKPSHYSVNKVDKKYIK